MTALEQLADRYVTEFAALDPCRAALVHVRGLTLVSLSRIETLP
ncbi:hypothetical protein [Actinomadura miaoliensis]